MSRKNADYWAGYNEEAARNGRPGNLEELAATVSRQFARDAGRKQRILARSPHLGYGLDAEEYEGMSSRELAKRELDEIGVKPDDRSIEEQLLDAHHGGRAYARDQLANTGAAKGGAASFNRLIGGAGSARDSSDGDFVDRYTNEEGNK